MLQISAGRFFRPAAPLNQHTHRRTIYTNALLAHLPPLELPVGVITASTEVDAVSTAMLEAVDRLEAQHADGTDEFLIATGGTELIDDVAYVATFFLNRTFTRDHDQVHRFVSREPPAGRSGGAAALFPGLFDPRQSVTAAEVDALKQQMGELIALDARDFLRAMRVIRRTVDATRRAIDDPTGAYTDLVAALESLADAELSTPVTWERYDSKKRKIIDAALAGGDQALAERVRTAILEADRAGLKRQFISSTLARVSPAYYRREALEAVRPPQSAHLERMLSIAYDIRSSRSHVLEDLGDEAWVFTDGAETVFEPHSGQVLTLAGLWRLVRHVVRRFIADAPKPDPEPWDYRDALPGIIKAQLAPQLWIGQPHGFHATTAEMWFNGVAEALIEWHAGHLPEGFDLSKVVRKIEALVPAMRDGGPKTAMVGIYALWHEWSDPKDHADGVQAFLETHGACLDEPSPVAFAMRLLGRTNRAKWTVDQWVELAAARRAARLKGKEAPLPATIDAVLQLEAADQLEAVGRHDEAVTFAAHAVEECPGREDLIEWEERLLAGDHDPNFAWPRLLFGLEPDGEAAAEMAQDEAQPAPPDRASETATDDAGTDSAPPQAPGAS